MVVGVVEERPLMAPAVRLLQARTVADQHTVAVVVAVVVVRTLPGLLLVMVGLVVAKQLAH